MYRFRQTRAVGGVAVVEELPTGLSDDSWDWQSRTCIVRAGGYQEKWNFSWGNSGVAKDNKRRAGIPSRCQEEVDRVEEVSFGIRLVGCKGGGIHQIKLLDVASVELVYLKNYCYARIRKKRILSNVLVNFVRNRSSVWYLCMSLS